MKKMSFSKQMIIGSLIGIAVGAILGKNVSYIKIFGDVFINLISMMVPFLIFGALVEAVMNLNTKDLGSVGVKTLASFVVTSSTAAALAIGAGVLLQPGAGVTGIQFSEYKGNATGMTFNEAILSFFPKNVVAAFNNNAITQIIMFAIIVGIVISIYKKEDSFKKIHDGVLHFNALVMKTVTFIMQMAPIGIFAIVATMIGMNGIGILLPLGKFLIIITAVNILCFVLVGLAASAYAKVSFFRMLSNVKRSTIVAATTTSSAMALPMKFKDAEENLGVSKRISKFVVPLAGTLNVDGGVILTTLASLTVCQIMGIELSTSAMIMIGVTSVLSSFGNTMVPGGGIVALAIVFSLNGIPLEGVALFAGIDWAMAITRVPCNVVDDLFCAVYVAASEKELDRDVFYGKKNILVEEPVNQANISM
ncbi:MAG: sodium:dicarboxylate symporter [Clostridia bacterium]|jgi:Na+/H+-dicarboxylate symporter|nr:sodium:dicarboxylate symporter [Clostridia bacterium]